jgi:hypothetical protein
MTPAKWVDRFQVDVIDQHPKVVVIRFAHSLNEARASS